MGDKRTRSKKHLKEEYRKGAGETPASPESQLSSIKERIEKARESLSHKERNFHLAGTQSLFRTLRSYVEVAARQGVLDAEEVLDIAQQGIQHLGQLEELIGKDGKDFMDSIRHMQRRADAAIEILKRGEQDVLEVAPSPIIQISPKDIAEISGQKWMQVYQRLKSHKVERTYPKDKKTSMYELTPTVAMAEGWDYSTLLMRYVRPEDMNTPVSVTKDELRFLLKRKSLAVLGPMSKNHDIKKKIADDEQVIYEMRISSLIEIIQQHGDLEADIAPFVKTSRPQPQRPVSKKTDPANRDKKAASDPAGEQDSAIVEMLTKREKGYSRQAEINRQRLVNFERVMASKDSNPDVDDSNGYWVTEKDLTRILGIHHFKMDHVIQKHGMYTDLHSDGRIVLVTRRFAENAGIEYPPRLEGVVLDECEGRKYSNDEIITVSQIVERLEGLMFAAEVYRFIQQSGLQFVRGRGNQVYAKQDFVDAIKKGRKDIYKSVRSRIMDR